MTNAQVPNIPPPPSGNISDTDPLAQASKTATPSIPPPPSGNISDTDPLTGAKTPSTESQLGGTGFEGYQPSRTDALATAAGDVYGMGKGLVQMVAAPWEHFSNAASSAKRGDYAGAVDSVIKAVRSINDPSEETVNAQLASSMQAKTRMMDAAKKGDALGVVQHAAGIIPGASQVDSAMTNYQKEPTRAKLIHVITTAAPMLVPGAISAGRAVTALPEAAASEMATAEAVAPEAASEAAEAAPEAEAAAEIPKPTATPVETAVTKGAAKSGLPAGKPATVALTDETIQPTFHRGYRDFVNKIATNNGLEPIPDAVPIPNVANELDNQFTARSQATFDQVEKITNVNPTALKDVMKARADQIEQAAASGDVEKAGNLEQLQLRDENRMAKAFKDAEAQNVSVDQARDDWNKSLRAGELSKAVRASIEGTTADPILNPAKLTPRLQKLSYPEGTRPGKLQQLTAAPTDAYPVKIEYSPEGDVLDLDGRHRVMQAIEKGDTRIGVQTKMRDGTVQNLKVDPNEVAKRFGVTKESLAASDANQPYRAPSGQPRAAVATSDTGENLASSLVEHAENARTASQAIKEFVPSSPTGQQALQELLRNNTTGKAGLRGKVTGNVDWNGAVKNFENLGPDEQAVRFGNDVEKVRQYLGKQVQRQTAINLLKKAAVRGAGAVGIGALGTLGYEWAK